MRVIAGKYRSRQLNAPKGMRTRPTSDRLRETLFNIISARLPGSRFADLYAGTGAVGIEAFSRDAAEVWFAEKTPPAVSAIRANLAALGIQSGYTIEPRGTAALLEKLVDARVQLDVVFLDPPWEAAQEYAVTLNFLGSEAASASVGPNTVVIAEHAARQPLLPRYQNLKQSRTLTQGDAALSFYARAAIKDTGE